MASGVLSTCLASGVPGIAWPPVYSKFVVVIVGRNMQPKETTGIFEGTLRSVS